MKFLFTVLMSLFTFNTFAAEITLTKDNTVVLNQEFNAETTAKVMADAQKLDAKLKSKEPIYLVLDTPGGSIQAGLEMITFLKSLNRPVHTVSLFAASMGFQTVQGLGTRYITPFGTLMAHKAKGGFQGEFPGQLDSRYVYYLQRLNELDRITVSRSKGKYTIKSLQALYENEHWVDGFNAVNEGFADEVVSVHCDQSLSGVKSEIFSFMGFSIRVQFSECPTITGPLAIEAMVHTDQGLMTLNEFISKGGSLSRSTTYYNTNDIFTSSTSNYGPQPSPVKVPQLTVDSVSIEAINKEIENIKKTKTRRTVVVKDNADK